jgi:hypothetical protein
MSHVDSSLALFLMLGQSAERTVKFHPETTPAEGLLLSDSYDLATVLPGEVRQAASASYVYKLFFVFENFLRDFVLGALSEEDKDNWWNKVPPDVQKEVSELEEKEENKAWMALGSRPKLALTTYPQLLSIIDYRWKEEFQDLIRDKSLIQEARHIGHIRNALCHMTVVPEEEVERVKQVIRDWFRVVAP